MHPRNLHKNGYPMDALCQSYPALKPFLVRAKSGKTSIDFTNANAVKALNAALLFHYYKLEYWDMPEGYLCPPVPGRADYIHGIADLLYQSDEKRDAVAAVDPSNRGMGSQHHSLTSDSPRRDSDHPDCRRLGIQRRNSTHMLDQVARHGLIDLTVAAHGDLAIDDHHTVEDVGITLGQAFAAAVGDKRGMTRYGFAYVPLDEALSRVVIDFSGRPGLFYNVPFTRASVGGFDVDLFQEFFQGFVNHSRVTLHIDTLKGENSHHQIETVFKAFGRALRMAVTEDSRIGDVIPSTKGLL